MAKNGITRTNGLTHEQPLQASWKPPLQETLTPTSPTMIARQGFGLVIVISPSVETMRKLKLLAAQRKCTVEQCVLALLDAVQPGGYVKGNSK